MSGLGLVAESMGEYDVARRYLDESLALYRTGGESPNVVTVLCALTRLALRRDEPQEAARLVAESLRIGRSGDYGAGIAESLEVGGALALRRGAASDAARILGATAALREQRDFRQRTDIAAWHSQVVEAIRAVLGEETFAADHAAGRTLSLDAAVAMALEQSEEPAAQS